MIKPGFTPTAIALDAACQADRDAGRDPLGNASMLSLAAEVYTTALRDGNSPTAAARLAALATGTDAQEYSAADSCY